MAKATARRHGANRHALLRVEVLSPSFHVRIPKNGPLSTLRGYVAMLVGKLDEIQET